jgi:hypothetical protein
MLDIKIVGDSAIVARLGALAPRVRARLEATMEKLGLDLHALVIGNLSGAVLKRRTGRLAQGQNIRRVDSATEITRGVGFAPSSAPYGVIHELTGARAHIIEARNARVLAFQGHGGETVFRKRVHHPGLPVRSFLRSALREIAPEAIREIETAVTAAMKE